MSEAPNRFCVKTLPLGELLTDIRNGLVAEQEKELPGIPITRIETISKGTVDMARVRYVRDTARASFEKFWLKKDDILFSHINSDLHLGKTAIVPSDAPLLHGMNLLRLRVDSSRLRPKYLHHWFDYCRRTGVFMAIAQHAVNQSSLNQKKITSLEVPLFSITVQDEIVAEIEKQFSRLDQAVANLKRVKANLKRYKAAVLKAAVEGRLVPAEAELARKEGRDYETGEQLLKRIRETRRKEWKGRGKYREPESPDDAKFLETPEGWTWGCLDQMLASIEAGASFKCTERPPTGHETGVLKVSAVSWGEFDELESKTCTDDSRLEDSFLVKKGDFLFSRANTIELVGACVIVNTVTRRLMLSDKTLRFGTVSLMAKEWLLVVLRSKFGRQEIERLATGNQDSMRNIGQERIRQIRFPIPPIVEMHRIVDEVERRLSLASAVESEVSADLARANRLRHSILGGVFSSDRETK